MKQPAWAAAISSSGFVPGAPSKRLANPYGCAASTPLCVEICPRPSLSPPVHVADPCLSIFMLTLSRLRVRRRPSVVGGLYRVSRSRKAPSASTIQLLRDGGDAAPSGTTSQRFSAHRK